MAGDFTAVDGDRHGVAARAELHHDTRAFHPHRLDVVECRVGLFPPKTLEELGDLSGPSPSAQPDQQTEALGEQAMFAAQEGLLSGEVLLRKPRPAGRNRDDGS